MLAGKLSDTENRLNNSVAEAAGMQMALGELQAAGSNKDIAVGNALKALEERHAALKERSARAVIRLDSTIARVDDLFAR